MTSARLMPLSSSSPQFRPLPAAGMSLAAGKAASNAAGAKAAMSAAGAKAAKDMESVFLKVLWQEMWQTVGQTGASGQGSFLPGGLAGDVYKDLLLSGLSDRMAEAGGLGLAKLIQSHLP